MCTCWNLSSKLLRLILHIIKLGAMLGIMGHRAGVQELVKEKSFERFYSFSWSCKVLMTLQVHKSEETTMSPDESVIVLESGSSGTAQEGTC